MNSWLAMLPRWLKLLRKPKTRRVKLLGSWPELKPAKEVRRETLREYWSKYRKKNREHINALKRKRYAQGKGGAA